MSDLELFKGNSLVNSDLFKSLQNTIDNLAGGSGGGMRPLASVAHGSVSWLAVNKST